MKKQCAFFSGNGQRSRGSVEPLESRIAPAAAGLLDLSFGGGDGVALVDQVFRELVESVEAMVVQTDGKLVLAGSASDGYGRLFPDIAVVRLNADGSPDAGFGTGGQVLLDFGGDYFSREEAFAVAVQSDGKIVVGGRALLTDLESEAGDYDFALARFTASGAVDGTFGTGGIVRLNLGSASEAVRGLAFGPGGTIYAVGDSGGDAAVVRLTPSGGLDATFDGDGKLVFDAGGGDSLRGVVLQSDGKLVAAGTTGPDFLAVRILAAGGLDTAFGNAGVSLVDFGAVGEEARAVALDAGGRIVLGGGTMVGAARDFALARLTSSGALDTAFDGDGRLVFNVAANAAATGAERIESLAIQADGNIVVAGAAAGDFNRPQWHAARVSAAGVLDGSFGTGGVARLALGVETSGRPAAAAISGGGLIIAGTQLSDDPLQPYSVRVMKLTAAGALNASFSGDGVALFDIRGSAENILRASLVQPDGSVFLAEDVLVTPRNSLAGSIIAITHLLPDGTRDPAFGVNGTVRLELGLSASSVQAMARVEGGSFFIAGARYFLPEPGGVLTPTPVLAKLNADGSLQTTFGTGGIVASSLGSGQLVLGAQYNDLAVLPDGKVLTLGQSERGVAFEFTVTRFNADGSLDTTFSGDGLATLPGTGGNKAMDTLEVMADGRVVVAGADGFGSLQVARLLADGSLDGTFGIGGVTPLGIKGALSGLGVNGDGSLLLGGSLSSFVGKTGAFQPIVVKLGNSGSLDGTFGDGGVLKSDIFLAEPAGEFARDATGRFYFSISDMTTFGRATPMVVRLGEDGQRDVNFGNDSGVTFENERVSEVSSLSFRADGSLLVAGGTSSRRDSFVTKFSTESVSPAGGLLGFSMRAGLVHEAEGQAVITVIRSGGSAGTVTVNYAITGGTATAGTDFTSVGGTLTFAPGETSKEVSIPLVVDAVGELDESIELTLSNATGGGELNTPSRYRVTILAHNGGLGTFDPNFGENGIGLSDHTDQEADREDIREMAYTPDGKIVAIGYGSPDFDFFVSRFNSDGTPDLTFGGDGSVTTDFSLGFDQAMSVGVLADGRIVVAGFTIAEQFGDTAVFGEDTPTVAGGTFLFAIARYNVDGTLDRTFGNNGLSTFDARVFPGMESPVKETILDDYFILPTGEIMAAVSFRDYVSPTTITDPKSGLIRFSATGELDATFAGDGFAEVGLAHKVVDGGASLAQQPDGKFIMALGTGDREGAGDEVVTVVRFNENGSRDTTFGTAGRMQFNAFSGRETREEVTHVALQRDGKILVSGVYAPVPAERGPSSDPLVDPQARDGGGFLARINTNGTLDANFSTDGLAFYRGSFPRLTPSQGSVSIGAISEVTELPNGKIGAVGFTSGGGDGQRTINTVLQFLPDGTLDPQFGINGALRATPLELSFSTGVQTGSPHGFGNAMLVSPANEIIAGFGGAPLGAGASANVSFALLRVTTEGAAGSLEWSFAESRVEESDGFASLTIRRLGGTDGAASVNYAFTSGTAQNGVDFTGINGTVIFEDGQAFAEIFIPLRVADGVETGERFSVTLSNATGATLGKTVTTAVEILDGPDRFEFSAPTINFLEGSAFASVSVFRKGAANSPASVEYVLRGQDAIAGVDFDAVATGTLRFEQGQNAATLRFAIRPDDLLEGRESLSIALVNPLGGPVLGNIATATVNIYDNPPGTGTNAGALDSNFGSGGVSAIDVFPGRVAEQSRDLAVQRDGKVVVVGESGGRSSDFLLVRYLPDGSLDPAFGSAGRVQTDFFGSTDSARAVAIDSFGRIVVAGWALREGRGDFAISRYLADGTPDSTFGVNGKATVDFSGFDDRASSLALAGDGRIAIGGWTSGALHFDMAAVMLNEDGTLDSTFSGDGRATVDFSGKQDAANAILVQPNGAVVIGGSSLRQSRISSESSTDFALARLTATGLLDSSFSSDGKFIGSDASVSTSNSVIHTMALRENGRIVFGGSAGGNTLIGEMRTDGRLGSAGTDNFTSAQLGGGSAITSSVETIHDVMIDADGRIVATGYTRFPGETRERLFVKRYLSDFRFDQEFAVQSVSVQAELAGGRGIGFAADGNILTTGGAFELAGILETSAGPKEGVFFLNATSYAVSETVGKLNVTVSRPASANFGIVSVDYSLVGISAQPGLDFTPVAGTLVFGETETKKTFSIPILNDAIFEGGETFGIVLSNPTGGAELSSASFAPVTIAANDFPASRGSFGSAFPGFDDFVFEGFALVTVTRSQGSLGAVSIDYHTVEGTAKAGEDFTPTFGTVQFANGETSKQIFIATTADDRIEGTETFYLKFTTPTGGSTLDIGLDTMTLAMSDSVPTESFAFAGRLDTAFDSDGSTQLDSGVPGADNFFGIARQPDGKIVAVGAAGNSGGFLVARFNADGSKDAAFGTDGKVVTPLGSTSDELAVSVRVQPDGKVLVFGATTADGRREELVMARYTASGALDKSFGTGGLAKTSIQRGSVALSFLQGNGDVIPTSDGGFLVSSFVQNGLDTDVALFRFLANGKLDASFGTGGTLTFDLGFTSDSGSSVTIQPDGKIVLTFSNGEVRAVRLNANGSVDSDFGYAGVVSANPTATLLSPGLVYSDSSAIHESLILPDGDILLLGQAFGSAKPANSLVNFTESLRGGVLMIRYNSDGTPDAGFGTNGIFESNTPGSTIQEALLDEAGKVLLVGGSTLSRVLLDGRSDPGFGPSGRLFTSGSTMLVQPDGRILVTGGSAFSSGDAQISRFVGGPAAGGFRMNVLTEKVSEEGGMVMIPVERVSGLDGAVSVTVSTTGGTAIAGSDFTATTQVLSWADGEDGVKFVSVPILGDLLGDANETFTVTLSSPTGGAGVSGTRGTTTVTIVDNDQPGVIEFSEATFLARENAATALLTVRREDGELGAVSVNYSVTGGTAVAGVHFTLSAGTVNFANGESEKTIVVSLIDNGLAGEDKTVVVTLATPNGGAVLGSITAARLTIQNDEIPEGGVFGFGTTDFETREDGGGHLVTILRTGGSSGEATVTLNVSSASARAGESFIPFETTVGFADGQKTATIFVPVFDDIETNGARSIELSLSSPTGSLVLSTLTQPTIGADSTARLAILDNDAFTARLSAGVFTFASEGVIAAEQGGVASLVIFRNSGSSGAASVTVSFTSGSAVAGRDFNATSIEVAFADGEISKTVAVPLRNDFLSENNESFLATLSDAAGGASLGGVLSAAVTIIDDEGNSLPDFNDDGKPDLLTTKGAKTFVRLGNSDGTFGSGLLLPAVKGAREFTFSDFDGDGTTDVVALNASKNSVFMLSGNGDGTFQQPVGFLIGKGTRNLVVADFNGDGRPDLAALQSKGVNVILNDGDGFAPLRTFNAGKSAGALLVGDFNGDGDVDIFVSNAGKKPAFTMLAGKGDGGFSGPVVSTLGKSAPGIQAKSVTAGDFNGDGITDITAFIAKNRLAFFSGSGGGRFGVNDIVASSKGAKFLVTGDFDDDLDMDLVSNAKKGALVAFANSGSGKFTPQIPFPAAFPATRIFACDVNGDEDPDLVFVNNKDQFKVFLGGTGISFAEVLSSARVARIVANR